MDFFKFLAFYFSVFSKIIIFAPENTLKSIKPMPTTTTTRRKKKLTREENIALNSKKVPRSKTMIFATEHKHMIIVNDPALFH